MQALGRADGVDPVAYANKATPGKSVGSKRDGGRRVRPNKAKSDRQRWPVRDKTDDVWTDALPKTLARSFREYIHELLADLDNPRGSVLASDRHAARTKARIDLSFGVEPLSYKNMWNVLKTVVREIGDIKEASYGRFFLGVSQRVDKATTLMEFNSIAGYLEKKAARSLEAALSHAAKEPMGQITSDPAASLAAQASIAPETVLHLLGMVG